MGLKDLFTGKKILAKLFTLFDKTYTMGYEYYMGIHYGVCHGPIDEIYEIRVADRPMWKGSCRPGQAVTNTTIPNPPSPAPDVIAIDQRKLFGGRKREGGVAGVVDVLFGGPTQGFNAYLQNSASPDVPAYRGITSLVFRSQITSSYKYEPNSWLLASPSIRYFRTEKLSEPPTYHTGFYWSAMSPYIKPISVLAFRALEGWDGGTPWYSAKAVIGAQAGMNGAHIVYEILTNRVWGMKIPVSAIDIPSFTAAADHYFDNNIALNMQWTGEARIEEFLGDVLAHLDAVVPFNPYTGKFVFNRLDAEYDVGTLFEITEADGSLVTPGTFSRPAWGETINELTVVYTRPDGNGTETVTAQSVANIAKQGVVIPQSVDYFGFWDGALAAARCERELLRMSESLATLTGVEVTRDIAGIVEGDVVLYTRERYGLNQVPFRVTRVDNGTLERGVITLDLVEDVFARQSSNYIGNPNDGWTDPSGIPSDVNSYRIEPIPYHTLSQYLGEALAQETNPLSAFFFVMAQRPDAKALSAEIYFNTTGDPEDASYIANGEFTPTAKLDGAIDESQTQFKFKDAVGTFEIYMEGTWFYVDDEKIFIESIVTDPNDANYKLMTVKRGVLDSCPAAHADNSLMWVFNDVAGAVYTKGTYFDGDQLYLYPLAKGAFGESSVDTAPEAFVTLSNDWAYPYPPANVQINGEYNPSASIKNFTITWAGRNRVQQTANFVSWYDGHIDPEVGTTYTLETYDPVSGDLVRRFTGLETGPAGGSFTYYDEQEFTDLRIVLYAVRDGFTSKCIFDHTVEISGYGYGYDFNYGGGINGVALLPGQVAPATILNNTPQTYFPFWANGRWNHMDHVANAEKVLSTRILPAPETLTAYSTDTAQNWTVENVTPTAIGATPTYRPEDAALQVVAGGLSVCANGQYIWTRSSTPVDNWRRIDVQTLPNLYSNDPGHVTSIRYDDNLAVFIVNIDLGADIYTTPDFVTFTRKGSNGQPNDATDLMSVQTVRWIAPNYVASGYNAITEEKVIATSADLVTWAAIPSTPQVGAAKDDWTYVNGYYYLFGSPAEVLVGFRSADGVNWTQLALGSSIGSGLIGRPFVMNNMIEVNAGPWNFRSTNGTTWTRQRIEYHPFYTPYARTKGQLDSVAAAGSHIMLRTGPHAEDATKDDTFIGNTVKGKVLRFTSWRNSNATLRYPSGADYGKDIGVLGDLSSGISDAGFKMRAGAGVAGSFRGRNTGDRYAEVKITALQYEGSLTAVLGVAAAVGTGETSGLSSVLVTGAGELYTRSRWECSGDSLSGPQTVFNVGNEDPQNVPYSLVAGDVIGLYCDFDNSRITLSRNGEDVVTVEGIDTSKVWYLFFGTDLADLKINLGQEAFEYKPTGAQNWN